MKVQLPAIIAIAILAPACASKDTTFTLVFANGEGVQAGQPLVIQGVHVGEVTSVDLAGGQSQIEARVFKKYESAVCAESTFLIEKPGGFFDASGDRQIAVSVRDGVCTPIKPGAIIRGQDSALAAAALAAKDMVVASVMKAKAMAENAAAEFSRSPVLAELGAAMRDFGNEVTSEKNAARLDALRQQAEQLRSDLEKAGKSAEAQALWQRFEEWYREAQKAIAAPQNAR